MEKQCTKCHEMKDISEFTKNKNSKDGFEFSCKLCYSDYRKRNRDRIKTYNQNYYKSNHSEILENNKKYREANSAKIAEQQKQYREANSAKIAELKRLWVEKNRELVNNYLLNYRKDNQVKLQDQQRIYYLNNKGEILKQRKDYYQKHKAKINQQKNSYIQERKLTDDVFKVKTMIRASIYDAFRRSDNHKATKTVDILGCNYKEFKEHIESQFEDWMTWDNYGKYNGEPNFGWDLDHIKPLALAESIEDVYILNHYTNFQPLCSYINRDVKRNCFAERND